MSTKVRIGDRVTTRFPEKPYSSSAYNWPRSAMFVTGMTGEVLDTPPCVRAVRCAECGQRHRTFLLVEFQWSAEGPWMPGEWDRAGLSLCNVGAS